MSSSSKTISENRVWETTGTGWLPAVDSAESWNLFFYWLKFPESRFPRFLAEILRATRLLVLRRSTRRYLRNASLEVRPRTVRETFSPVVTGRWSCVFIFLARVPTRAKSPVTTTACTQRNSTLLWRNFDRSWNFIAVVTVSSMSFFPSLSFSFFLRRYTECVFERLDRLMYRTCSWSRKYSEISMNFFQHCVCCMKRFEISLAFVARDEHDDCIGEIWKHTCRNYKIFNTSLAEIIWTTTINRTSITCT